ncbi:conserved hypothetical protein [Hyella patelloides LEGE 07179]|uniref:Na+-translocating membrane potential-generating system MpsC domain-containing protein n=1 Tax=Hyella patelloides LEGE 07179 TaxID=945734 RepID=A0A563VR44_9CYAN|nr:DUF2294 domain-containing protein [Hyella patelloides]VEP13893.1 conserved hypothetical protein [Hyella patelloides LEGE 07179]
MTDNLLTRGQLERKLSQKIQAFYNRNLGHQPSKVTSQFFDAKLAVIIEDSITNAEQILVDEGQNDLAEKVRSNLDDAIQPELKQLIEEITQVKVVDILSDATLDTGRTGIIVVLSKTPKVRNPENIPKVKS